jgi:hypothetical protein
MGSLPSQFSEGEIAGTDGKQSAGMLRHVV